MKVTNVSKVKDTGINWKVGDIFQVGGIISDLRMIGRDNGKYFALELSTGKVLSSSYDSPKELMSMAYSTSKKKFKINEITIEETE